MSSPFSPRTKKGTEETIEALSHSMKWLSLIDTHNDVTDIDIQSFDSQLQQKQKELIENHQVKTTEVAVDNFVFNHEGKVEQILCGGLDDKVSALNTLQNYINDDFGYVDAPSLNKENLLWLVAQEVLKKSESPYGLEDLSPEEVIGIEELESLGTQPEMWAGGYPQDM